MPSAPNPPRTDLRIGARRARPVERFALGLVPGLKAVAHGDVRTGAVSLGLGLGLLVGIALLLAGWPARSAGLTRLRIHPTFDLVDLAVLGGLVLAYEGLRLAHDLEERTRRPWAPRLVAALLVPSAAAVVVLPSLIGIAPRPLEAAWWGALVLGLGAVPAAVWCAIEHRVMRGQDKRRFATVSAAGLGALVGGAMLLPSLLPATVDQWAETARRAGFELLPRVLGI